MAVALTVSETLDGAAVSDSLAGGGTGVDLGSVVTSSFAPLVDKPTNDGRQNIFIRHNGTEKITSVKTFMQTFGTGTGFTYGGADSAANDFTTMKNLANASGSSKNNNDGLSGGLWIDMDTDVTTTNQFDFATNGPASGTDTVRIYGDGLTDGVDVASAFTMVDDAMVIDSDQSNGGDGTNGFIPNGPVDGEIGDNGDTTLGDNAHVGLRIFVRSDTTNGGIVQWEWVIAYSFTI